MMWKNGSFNVYKCLMEQITMCLGCCSRFFVLGVSYFCVTIKRSMEKNGKPPMTMIVNQNYMFNLKIIANGKARKSL